MTTYNGGQFLREQLDSILKQTIEDFELIICDDCSTDNTSLILQEYAEKDNRVNVVVNTENLGFVRNFEKSISLCKGEYIALSDQDDIWYPNHLELLLGNIQNKMLVVGNSMLMSGSADRLIMGLKYQLGIDYEYTNGIELVKTILFFRSWFQGASMMMRREFLSVALPIPEGVKYHDSWFAVLACFIDSVVYVDEFITKYRQHGSNTSDKHLIRRNKFLIFLKHLFIPNAFPDRLRIACALKNRVPNMTQEQSELIMQAIEYHTRQHLFWGRIKNAIYEMRDRKVIYSIK